MKWVDAEANGKVNLTLAHLRIAYMVGNSEVGNSEYIGHKDCPPQSIIFQPVCLF